MIMTGAFIESFMAATGFWFWALFLVDFIFVLAFVANDRVVEPFVAFLVLVLATQFVWKVNLFGQVVDNPFIVLGFFGVYIVCGVVWSLFEWSRVIGKYRNKYIKFLESFSKRYNCKFEGTISSFRLESTDGRHTIEELKKGFESAKNGYDGVGSVPVAKDNKAEIISWMMYWPFSVLWFALSDFLVDIWNLIYKMFASLFDGVSKRFTKDIVELENQNKQNKQES
jgi:hypothetical protein